MTLYRKKEDIKLKAGETYCPFCLLRLGVTCPTCEDCCGSGKIAAEKPSVKFSEFVQDELLRDAVVSKLRAVAAATAELWDALRDCEHEYGKDIEYSDDLIGMLAGGAPNGISDSVLLKALDDACKIED